jgi:hypothetical protein
LEIVSPKRMAIWLKTQPVRQKKYHDVGYQEGLDFSEKITENRQK